MHEQAAKGHIVEATKQTYQNVDNAVLHEPSIVG